MHTLIHACTEKCQTHIPKFILIQEKQRKTHPAFVPKVMAQNHSFETEQLFKSCYVETLANLRYYIAKDIVTSYISF